MGKNDVKEFRCFQVHGSINNCKNRMKKKKIITVMHVECKGHCGYYLVVKKKFNKENFNKKLKTVLMYY